MPDRSPEAKFEGGVGTPLELRERRDSARRSLLRANSVVALVIGTVLLLALAAWWQSVRAIRAQNRAELEQQRAEHAEGESRADLWRALVAETRSVRLGQTLDRRERALDTIRRAAAITPAPELRDEAVAVLALPEYRLEFSVPLQSGVRAHAFSPDLQYCAQGLTNGDVVIYRFADGAETGRLPMAAVPVPPEQGPVAALEFGPDGQLLSVRHWNGALVVWDVTSGRPRFTRDLDQPRRPASRGQFSDDGQFVIAPVFTPDGFEVIQATNGRTVAHFPQINSYHHCAVRPGTHQFAAYDGSRVRLLDWDTRREVADFPFPYGARTLAWDPAGDHLAIAGNSLGVHLWDVTRRQLRILTGHQDSVSEVRFDLAGERLATTSLDGKSRMWDLRDGQLLGAATDRHLSRWGPKGRSGWVVPRDRLEIRRPTASDAYASVVGVPDQADGWTMDVSPDGNWAVSKATADGLLVWNLNQRRTPLLLAVTNVQSLCFDPRRPRLLVVREQRLEAREYRVTTNAAGTGLDLALGEAQPVPWPDEADAPVDLVTVSADGQTRAYVHLLSGRVWAERLTPPSGLVLMQDLQHSSVDNQSGSPSGSGTVALSPDGSRLVCSVDGKLGTWVYDTRSGRPLNYVSDDFGEVQFSPDGRWLALAHRGECQVFGTGDWRKAWQRRSDRRRLVYHGVAAFSPDGSQLAYVRSPKDAVLVDTATGRELAVLEAPAGSPLNRMRWTADGRRLVMSTRENSLDLWQPAALQRELAALGIHWHTAASAPVAAAFKARPPTTDSLRGLSLAALLVAGVVSVVALLSLRRHRKLILDFTHSEAQASHWERQLQVEREVSRLKSSFVSMVTHEFRTPLGIIQSSAQILGRYLDRLPVEERREQVDSITKNVRRMSHLIDEVLVLGRADGGQMRFEPAPLDLAGFVRRLADEMLSATNRVCPIIVAAGELPPAVADENLLRHILTNLVSNAVKYSSAGAPVEVALRAVDGLAVITVRDRGMGIPVADQAKIFTAFLRGSNVGEVRGTGLGLNIVKQCVDRHGGEIEFESQEGRGTVFTIRLPLFRG